MNMASPHHSALPVFLRTILKPNPDCTSFQMRLREIYRINMTRGLALDLFIAITFVAVAIGVNHFIHPFPLPTLIWGWVVLWLLTWVFKLPSIRRPELDANFWIILGYGTTAIAVGMSFGLVDRVVNAPLTVLGTIGIGGSWMLFPQRGWRAVVGPVSSSIALAIAYLATFNFAFPSNNFWLALIAGSWKRPSLKRKTR